MSVGNVEILTSGRGMECMGYVAVCCSDRMEFHELLRINYPGTADVRSNAHLCL